MSSAVWRRVGRAVAAIVLISAAAVGISYATTPAPAPVAAPFVSITPCRAVDTRQAGGPVGGGTSRTFQMSGSASLAAQGGPVGGCPVPSSALAVAVNVTVTATVAHGNLSAFPADAATPATSTLNWSASGQTIANGTQVGLDRGQIKVAVAGPTSSAQVIIDIVGYYAAPVLPASAVPSGATLTGAFDVELPYQHLGTAVGLVNFVQPFAAGLTAEWVPVGTTTAHCTGSPGDPTAAPGYFCAYIVQLIGATNTILDPSTTTPAQMKTGRMAALLVASTASGGSQATVYGMWAATAP
jgi:hypothetical protein